MRRWLVPVVLALAAASSGVAALRAPAAGGAEPGGPAPAVAVLSARRAPAFLARAVADARLRAQLEAALANPTLGQAAASSCLVVHQGPRSVVALRAGAELIPASNLKILTATAALARLGPDERFVTEVRASAPAAGGVVDGPLWLVGGGDPLLATADYAAHFENQPQVYTPLESLADAVVAAGVREVRGGVVGDESRYDSQRYIPTWKPTYITDFESGPASALDVNDGFVSFAPLHVAAPQPDLHAATVFATLLQARGVTVAGGPAEGRAPAATAVVASVPSPPLRDVVGEMLRESDNQTAELLVKELGHRFAGSGTTAAGLGVVRDTLAGLGLPVSQLSTVDGSGLDRSDRATCGLLLAAVDRAGPAGPLAAGFPVAGRDGTLAKRFAGNPAAGRLRAKTGSVDGVAALSGWVDPPPGGTALSFSLVVNDLPRDALGRALQEQVGAILARYPEAPTPDALAPH
ncbi:MAG TPA: D-alanyl-D-alanine carboxypeptidase/D-alanyl-D-alanine-endopeptidase [Acidimicrobiales bacterium]|nr:D-alanyl-D-alanine carboxypeptidase/D-alanyl-D-alanine-endopeptidase [Acidimicrobiales bacterium]